MAIYIPKPLSNLIYEHTQTVRSFWQYTMQLFPVAAIEIAYLPREDNETVIISLTDWLTHKTDFIFLIKKEVALVCFHMQQMW